MIELNVIDAAFAAGVKRLIFLGSSCIYPREAPQPLKEEYLLTGPLEETNRPYAIAKIAGIELCRSLNREYGTDYLSLMPTNLYGPGDNFDLESSHVLPALIRKFHDAKAGGDARAPVGHGRAAPRVPHVDDLAEAVVFCLANVSAGDVPDGLLNVGSGEDLTIAELAELVQRVVGHEGPIDWDTTQPDGTPRKLLDVRRIKALGWPPRIDLEEGIRAHLSTGIWRRRRGSSDQDRTHHRRHRPGRRLPRRAPARQGLHRPRHQAPRLARSTPTASTTSTRTRTRPTCASSCTTATSPTPPTSSASCRRPSPTRSTTWRRRATCRSASRRRSTPPTPTRSARCACSRRSASSAWRRRRASTRPRPRRCSARCRSRRSARPRPSTRAAPTAPPSSTPTGSR